MFSKAGIIARKEMLDHVRDIRSLVSAVLYALMGPAVVFLVSLTVHSQASDVLTGMMSVFTLVAAFVGGMSIAMDTVAGERERRSLLPLLLNPVLRHDVLIGKWLAVSMFSAAGLVLNLLGFAVVFATRGMRLTGGAAASVFALAVGVVPLCLLAASVQLLISTLCRSTKEAQNYLSMIVFAPMLVGMFLVFNPWAPANWLRMMPISGQQMQLEVLMKGGVLRLAEPLWLGCFTATAALLLLFLAADRLDRDEIIYGN